MTTKSIYKSRSVVSLLLFIIGFFILIAFAPLGPEHVSRAAPDTPPYIAFLPLMIKGGSQASCETRGVWLNTRAFAGNEKAVTLQTLQNAHINTAFLIAPPIGGNYGSGNAGDFSAMMNMLHDAGIAIHIWIANAYRQGAASPADFTNPIERNAQKEWVIDLLSTYPQASGIHLDYIRYMNKTLLDAAKIGGINQTVADIYDAVKVGFPTKYVTAAVLSFSQECVVLDSESLQKDEWANQTPQWFKNWMAARPIPPYSWHNNFWLDFDWYPSGTKCQRGVPNGMKNQQDAISWLNANKIDNIISMEYIADHLSYWQDQYRILSDMLTYNNVPNPKERAYMGLGWFETADYTQSNLTSIVNKIKGGRTDGLKGMVIFEIGRYDYTTNTYTDDTPLVNALTVDSSINNNDAPFADQANSCISQ